MKREVVAIVGIVARCSGDGSRKENGDMVF